MKFKVGDRIRIRPGALTRWPQLGNALGTVIATDTGTCSIRLDDITLYRLYRRHLVLYNHKLELFSGLDEMLELL